MITKENAKEYLPLIQALAEGKTVQVNRGTKEKPMWDDPLCPLIFNCPSSEYRIKPEPRTFYVLEYPDGSWSYNYGSRHLAEQIRDRQQAEYHKEGRKDIIKILTLKEVI